MNAERQGLIAQLEGLAGKTVLVTGASSGIGRSVAVTMAAAGARVVLVARRRPLLEEVAAEVGRAGGRALVVPADVGDQAAVRDGFARAVEETARIDVVVNNAGVLVPGPVSDLAPDDFERMLQVNLVGALFVMQEAVRHMRQRGGGSIVNVASLAGRRGVSPLGGYCATKFGLIGLTEALRMEVRGEGIHVGLVLPGFVDTAMVEGAAHEGEILGLWPSWFTMPPVWVAWAVMAAVRFRLIEVSVPPGAATLEKIAALAPGLSDTVTQWAGNAGHWLASLQRR
jgi:NAD(P)-dependent dehydrogenase (short-subunit alcohol dehydrogenase family)